jgi:hypothetical protein
MIFEANHSENFHQYVQEKATADSAADASQYRHDRQPNRLTKHPHSLRKNAWIEL